MFKAEEDENKKILNSANNLLIDLRNNIEKKKAPKCESDKIIDIVEKVLNFNNQQKGKDSIEILTLKQML